MKRSTLGTFKKTFTVDKRTMNNLDEIKKKFGLTHSGAIRLAVELLKEQLDKNEKGNIMLLPTIKNGG